MQHLEVSVAVRPLKWSLGVKWLITHLKEKKGFYCDNMKDYRGRGSIFPFILNLLKTKLYLLYIRNQSVPRCKHFPPRL